MPVFLPSASAESTDALIHVDVFGHAWIRRARIYGFDFGARDLQPRLMLHDMLESMEESEIPLLPLDSVSPIDLTQKHVIKATRSYTQNIRKLMAIVLIFLVFAFWDDLRNLHTDSSNNYENLCPQAQSLVPQKRLELWETLGDQIGSQEYLLKAVDLLAGAVKIPTESYDVMGIPGEDPRWEVFGTLQEYLSGAFPLIHSTLKLTKINTYALWYEWKGSDPSLKPVLLTAHQDVVPVDPTTTDRWTHPPYSGHFDGQRVWGRGSSDDKGSLIAMLSAIESLLEKGFEPTRTFVLAFGVDEEAGGTEGAGALAEALLSAYGEDNFAMIVDEGGGYAEEFGGIFATPGIAEKGYLDVRVEVRTAGGHSSVPPSHTSIGILSRLLVNYEDHPYAVHLSRTSPVYGTLQCFAAHAPSLPSPIRKTIQRSIHSKKALKKLEKILISNPKYKSLIGTTQAIDVVSGGVKSNALPEQAWAIVNHRISTDSSLEEVIAHETALSKSLASKFNLTYIAFGTNVTDQNCDLSVSPAATAGTLTLTDATGTALNPAPITPTGEGEDSAPYQLLSGTIKATYNAHHKLEIYGHDTINVSPGLPTGNTDTRFYWKLSRHIFRYNHRNSDTRQGVHTVDEAINVDSFLEIIRFFSTLILNADESRTI